MKKIIIIFALVILASCQKSNNILQPVNNEPEKPIVKNDTILNDSLLVYNGLWSRYTVNNRKTDTATISIIRIKDIEDNYFIIINKVNKYQYTFMYDDTGIKNYWHLWTGSYYNVC